MMIFLSKEQKEFIKFLIDNKEKLEKLIKDASTRKEHRNYSVSGVPNFQKEYVEDLLKEVKEKED